MFKGHNNWECDPIPHTWVWYIVFTVPPLFHITSCAAPSKNKKKAINNTPVLPFVSLESKWYLLCFGTYS